MKQCIFCGECLDNKEPPRRIIENKFFYAMFDAHPIAPGHALIISKRHAVSLLDLTREEWIALKPMISKTIKKIELTNFKKIYTEMIKKQYTEKSPKYCKRILKHLGINKKPEAYNIGNNDGEAAGRTVHHLHIQIIPRFKGDVEDFVGGIRHIIPEGGNYKK
jgi:diadenosine tetraphosphate (Ap4A) HIT family hydrolase